MAAAPTGLQLRRPYILLFIFFIFLPTLSYSITEAEALLKFKQSLTNADALSSWVPSSAPCATNAQWDGVVCFSGIVTGLRLGGKGLSGEPDLKPLMEIKGIRTMSFINNNFTGSIPEFNLMPLRAIYLSGNQFSGEIPKDFFANMDSLKKVWLDKNKFTGGIPDSLGKPPNLQELHLENNEFSGIIPENINQTMLNSLDLSNNKLEGEIPKSMEKFNESSFAGNSGLCGGKLGRECKPAGEPIPSPSPSPSPSPTSSSNDSGSKSKEESSRSTIIIALLVTCGAILLILILVLFIKSKKKDREDIRNATFHGSDGPNRPEPQKPVAEEAVKLNVAEMNKKELREVDVESSRSSISSKKGSTGRKGSSGGRGGMPELVMLNEQNGVFGLPDLMKASAEVLGNGGLGSSYKAVMANGLAVVVKRVREMNALGKEGFDAEMRKFGTLSHRNILTPVAYHYRREEKLFVYEYIPKCSFLYLLHGDRGPSHAELDWPTRLKIIQGTAKGMGYIHSEFPAYDLPHGNLKSSNILIGPDFEPLLSDFAFAPLINHSHVAQALIAYKAPEAIEFGQVSPKCDVFSLGIVILETLTGKFPSQYLQNGKGGIDVVQWVRSAISEGRESELLDPEIAGEKDSTSEMEKLLHIGAACTENELRQRLDLTEAIRRIEQIKIVGARTMQVQPSLRDGYAESSSLPRTTHAPTLREGVGEMSASRRESNNFRSRSTRQNSGGDAAFSIS